MSAVLDRDALVRAWGAELVDATTSRYYRVGRSYNLGGRSRKMDLRIAARNHFWPPLRPEIYPTTQFKFACDRWNRWIKFSR
jgi:hypothetical protein